MTTLAGRLAEVKSYFDNGDTHVGYRRLLDLAIETQDNSVYKSTLEFCNWYDTHGSPNTNETGRLNEQVNTLQFIVSIFRCDFLLYPPFKKMAYHAGRIVNKNTCYVIKDLYKNRG